jgi:hypothetical protein
MISIAIPDSIFSNMPNIRPVYLCAPFYDSWIPVDMSIRQNGQVVFNGIQPKHYNVWEYLYGLTDLEYGTLPNGIKDNIEKEVFRVACWDNNHLEYLTDPFIVSKSGEIRFLSPEKKQETVCLYAKYNLLFEGFVQHLIGSVFEASNNFAFNRADTLYQITKPPLRLFNSINIQTGEKYRYIRLLGADYCSVSEIQIYGSDQKLIKGKPFGSIAGQGIKNHGYENAFDGNPYTSFYSPNLSGDWVGVDLGQPYHISRIVYTPRNRDNFIRSGDVYELSYSSGKKNQIIHQQTAASDSMVFENVPVNALLYLKNLSRGGNEQRVFIVKNHTQIFF